MFSKVTKCCVSIIVLFFIFTGVFFSYYSHNIDMVNGELMSHFVNPFMHYVNGEHPNLNNVFHNWHSHEKSVVTLSGIFLDKYADNEEEFDLTQQDKRYLAFSGYFFGSEASGLLTTVKKE